MRPIGFHPYVEQILAKKTKFQIPGFKTASIKGKFIDLTKEGYLIIKKNNKNKIILSGTMGLY